MSHPHHPETWTAVCTVRDIVPNTGVCALVDDKQVAVFRIGRGDEVYAIDNFDPNSQAAVLSRLLYGGHDPRTAVAAPRWLLGRTWAEQSTTLKVESRYGDEAIARLRALGHPVEVVADFDERMGHAGALVRHPGGLIEGGEDPRSDGQVAAW